MHSLVFSDPCREPLKNKFIQGFIEEVFRFYRSLHKNVFVGKCWTF